MRYWPSVAMLLTAAVVYGESRVTLNTKMDKEQVNAVVEKVVKRDAYPKTDGKVLENNLKHIRDDLKEIKQMLKDRR